MSNNFETKWEAFLEDERNHVDIATVVKHTAIPAEKLNKFFRHIFLAGCRAGRGEWSSTKPTHAGVYWYRENELSPAIILSVVPSVNKVWRFGATEYQEFITIEGQWRLIIAPAESEQP